VIDADGHMMDFMPAIFDELEQVGGGRVVDRFRKLLTEGDRHDLWSSDLVGFGNPTWYRLSWEERRRRREFRPAFWGHPVRNTQDLATSMLPGLLYERLQELGFDFVVTYPGFGLCFPHLEDEELRRASCRAINIHNANQWRPYADRVTPAAVVPMHTPDEAIEELEHAVCELGLKVVLIAGFVERRLQTLAERDPAAAYHARWIDAYGIDSAHDYDPFWSRCEELGVPLTQHSSASMARSWTTHRIPSNYQFHQQGNFADAGAYLCKSLFMGGVTHRFPALNFAFLEGGVGWGCTMYNELMSRWKKRNKSAVRQYDPQQLDTETLTAILNAKGPKEVARFGIDAYLGQVYRSPETDDTMDDFVALPVDTPQAVSDLFAPRFFFGCEADDVLVPFVLSRTQAEDARVHPILGSDIGHWDIPDMTGVLPEAYELVQDGDVTPGEFEEFVFLNAVRLYTRANPSFFDGTAIEGAVAAALDREQAVPEPQQVR
jgi:predicted TIM-barrel fold metal-dependent hydrolase